MLVENSWAVMNGFSNGGASSPADGNGNGFKMGSSQTGIRHIVQNNVAWKNKASGFYANHSTGGNNWYNNTSFMNGTQYNMLASPAGDPNTTITLTGALAHKMRNNIGFPNKNANMTGVDTAFNTWDLNIAQAASDFVNTTLDTWYQGPRQADGSMPNIGFLQPGGGQPAHRQGDQRRASVRGRGAGSRRVRIRPGRGRRQWGRRYDGRHRRRRRRDGRHRRSQRRGRQQDGRWHPERRGR